MTRQALAEIHPEPVPALVAVPDILSSGVPQVRDSVAVGHLRAFVTLMVLAHHALLAYHPFAPKPAASLTAQPRLWEAFPVADPQHWDPFALVVGFNDTFFMSLMFFLSGLFVWSSLRRKGSGGFLRDRALRLGLPFAVAAGVLAPLAYYPAFLQTGGSGLAPFWRQWSALGDWPAGPAWFLWVLLAFGAAAAGLTRIAPGWGERLGRVAGAVGSRPALAFALLVAVSAAAYLPLSLAFNPFSWASFGPFFFQSSRILLYFVYFLAGIAVGAWGVERGLLAPNGKLARRWPLWSTASVLAFFASLGMFVAWSQHPSRGLEVVGGVVFALSCAASSFAFLALFVRFAGRPGRVLDSLRANAYGMYLVHYAFASWLQLALLQAPLGAPVKGALAFLGTVALSWGATAVLRRIPAVARVI